MAAKKPLAKITAPTTADKLDAIGEEVISARIANCEFIHVIAASYGVSAASLHAWLDKHPEMYARARERQADKLAEDLLKIADDGVNDTYLDEDGNKRTDQDVIARSRLRVDARKWLAGKMAPKKYGDKVTNELVGKDDGPIEVKSTVMFESDAIAMLSKIKGDK